MVAAVFYPGYLGGLCFFTGCVVKAILVSWCMYSDKEAMIWVKLKLKILSNRVLRKRGHFRCESHKVLHFAPCTPQVRVKDKENY